MLSEVTQEIAQCAFRRVETPAGFVKLHIEMQNSEVWLWRGRIVGIICIERSWTRRASAKETRINWICP